VKTARILPTIANAQYIRVVFFGTVAFSGRLRDLYKMQMFTHQRAAFVDAMIELDKQRKANPNCTGTMGLFRDLDVQVDLTEKPV